MIVLVTSDFFADFELIQTENIDKTKDRIKEALSGKDIQIDQYYTVIGSSDDTTTEEAQKAADEVIYLSDFEED